ncbi:hypothetical protein MN116_002720 [Schistosoma mekongi]|uniref:Deoxynucleotidyltransferase terminal-interacting protein 1 n=1 Tax=Schistosoma mekongi TaxID=38744 RepID=A0AAE1ZGL0_SCHME|nr:hypothetical protein MN116_002720 [Schistosoma mekongi]
MFVRMDQSIKLNQCCSPSPVHYKLVNGVQTKASRPTNVDHCQLPCNPQNHKFNITSPNSIKETCAIRNSFCVPENRETILKSFCRQIGHSVLPSSDFILSYCKPTDLQLTSNYNHIASVPSVFQPFPLLLQSTSSSVISVSSSSNLSSFQNSYNTPLLSIAASIPFSSHPCPSYCSFSSHSLKPISSVKPYLSSNHMHSESSRIMSDNAMKSKSFNPITTLTAPTTASVTTTVYATTSTTATITTSAMTRDCPYQTIHYSSNGSLSSQDSKFSFLYPSVFNFSSPKAFTVVESNDVTSSLTNPSNSIAHRFPVYSLNIPQTCVFPPSPPLSSSSSLLTCGNIPQLTTQSSDISSTQLHNNDISINNRNDKSSDNFKNDLMIINGISSCSFSSKSNNRIINNSDLNTDKKSSGPNIPNLSAPSTAESLTNTDEKCNSLPRFNLRYANVLHYPKYSNRKNSGFERRLKHTGLILDAKLTLHLLRKFLQPYINRDFDQLLKKYMDDIILLAVNNIRDVLGEQSVSETDLNKFRQSLIRRVALRYFPERDHGNSYNQQETKSNPASEFGNNKSEEQNIQKSAFNIHSTTSSSPVFQSKFTNSKPYSNISTTDSLESVYFNNSSRLSPIPTSDSINFEKSLNPNNTKDPVIEKTFQTEHPTIDNQISREDEAHYSLRSSSNYSSLRSVRKRQHPSNRPKISPNFYDNTNYFSINTESLTTKSNDVNYLPRKCANLPFFPHSPSSASSNSTVGFFRDPFSSDSEGTVIGSNTTLSEQGNIQLPHKSSSFKINCSTSLSSTVKKIPNASFRRMKSKASRGRKASWWHKTRTNKSKSKVITSTNNKDRIEHDEHVGKLMDNKTLLAQNDLHQSVSTLSNQPSTSSVIHTSININNVYLHNANHVIHDHEDCDDDSSGVKNHTCIDTLRLSRKHLTAIKNNVNTNNKFVTRNSSVTKFTFDQNTPFALGSSANAWLGMGTARGRIYSKHPELFRYICDNEDKAWLVQTGLIISHGVKAYLVHAEQVHQIAQQINSYSSKLNNTVRTEKLKTFKLPQWFLQKVKVVASRHVFFSHITSTELDLINKEAVTNEQDNSSTVDTSPPPLQSASLSFSPMTRTNIRKFKVDNSLSISNPIEINHSTIHNVPVITTISSSKKIQNSPIIVSSLLSSSCSLSVTPNYCLATSSLQDYHETDNHLISSDSISLPNRNQTKLNCKSTMDDDNNNLVNTLHSQPSPNPPTLERFDYSTNK